MSESTGGRIRSWEFPSRLRQRRSSGPIVSWRRSGTLIWFPAGTPDQSDANRKMKEINEAYGLIQYAPLRYHAESYPEPGRITPSWTSGPREPIRDAPPSTGAFEYAVRFVCGALLGGLFALRIWLRPSLGWHVGGATVAVLALAFGLAAARFGDDFWRGVLGRWWMWR